MTDNGRRSRTPPGAATIFDPYMLMNGPNKKISNRLALYFAAAFLSVQELPAQQPAERAVPLAGIHIRDPYILEFLGIPQGEHFLETDLEQLLISRLQRLMLELGKGFAFVARQKRISFDDKHFYIDLVFYNYLARCFVLIDLKSGELTHQDLGQMQMYVNYYTRELMNPGDNPPVGIVLCAEKNDAVVRYTLPEDEKQVFAAQYMTYLPTQEELQTLLQEV